MLRLRTNSLVKHFNSSRLRNTTIERSHVSLRLTSGHIRMSTRDTSFNFISVAKFRTTSPLLTSTRTFNRLLLNRILPLTNLFRLMRTRLLGGLFLTLISNLLIGIIVNLRILRHMTRFISFPYYSSDRQVCHHSTSQVTILCRLFRLFYLSPPAGEATLHSKSGAGEVQASLQPTRPNLDSFVGPVVRPSVFPAEKHLEFNPHSQEESETT